MADVEMSLAVAGFREAQPRGLVTPIYVVLTSDVTWLKATTWLKAMVGRV